MQVATKQVVTTTSSLASDVVVESTPNDHHHHRRHEQRDEACEKVRSMVSRNAVVVFTISGCCMCHVVKQLLFGLGVGPTIVELDRDASGGQIHALLSQLSGGGGQFRQRQPVVPAVFVGGKFLGGIEAVMSCHINGTLVPLLKEAGALWL